MFSFKLVAIKLMTASKAHLEKHYEDLKDKPFFPGLVTCTPNPKSILSILLYPENLRANIPTQSQTWPRAQSALWSGKAARLSRSAA